jgi:subtilisin family serine protease
MVKANMQGGDVLLLPVALPTPGGELPIEADPAIHALITMAVNNNIIVIEAAGNSAIDLDETRKFDRRNPRLYAKGGYDTGAIIVGASFAKYVDKTAQGAQLNPPGHYRADTAYSTPLGEILLWGPGSNYGSRIDCYAWGQNVVSTSGSALLTTGTPPQNSYAIFGGTSAASAIVAGAALCIQGVAKRWQKLILPKEMRHYFLDPTLGTPQADLRVLPGNLPGGNIGVMPDLKKILAKIIP